MDTNELFNAIKLLESEKNIKRESLFDAIKVSLINACKTYYGTDCKIIYNALNQAGDDRVYKADARNSKRIRQL